MISSQKMVDDLLSTGIKQPALARLLGVSQPTVSRFLTGKSKPLYETGKRLETLHRERCGAIQSANQ